MAVIIFFIVGIAIVGASYAWAGWQGAAIASMFVVIVPIRVLLSQS